MFHESSALVEMDYVDVARDSKYQTKRFAQTSVAQHWTVHRTGYA